MQRQLLLVNQQLRSILEELQLVLGAVFDQAEIERLFFEVENDQVSPKTYLFYQFSHWFFKDWAITGTVEAYEPETVFIEIQGSASKRRKFDTFFADRQDY